MGNCAILEKTKTNIKLCKRGCRTYQSDPNTVCLYFATKSRCANRRMSSRYCQTSAQFIDHLLVDDEISKWLGRLFDSRMTTLLPFVFVSGIEGSLFGLLLGLVFFLARAHQLLTLPARFRNEHRSMIYRGNTTVNVAKFCALFAPERKTFRKLQTYSVARAYTMPSIPESPIDLYGLVV